MDLCKNIRSTLSKVPNVRQILSGGILLSTALSSSAITLGHHSGAGMLGRSLDIRVEAILAPDEAAQDICVSADVLYGETKLSPTAVRATLQRSLPDARASVRIQTTVAIDEPVVTVVLRAGCSAPFTRRYVLLADPISEPARSTASEGSGRVKASPDVPTALPLPVVSDIVPSDTSPVPATRTTKLATPPDAPARAPVVRAPRAAADRVKPPARTLSPQPSKVVRGAAAPQSSAAPRLELDAIDLSPAVESDSVLKLSLSMLSEPASSEEERAAAGRLWRAVNASPEDTLRDADKLEALSAELSALRESQSRSQATISELTSRVEQSRQWEWLSYTLGAFLALALLALLRFWRQQKTRPHFADEKAWWAQEEAPKPPMSFKVQQPVALKDAPPVDLDFDLTAAPQAARSRLQPLLGSASLDASDELEDIDLDIDSTPAPLPADRVDFSASQAASRSVATEELFDVQQQADFFISLGEVEQAIKVLRDHIAESQVPSPLVYLDLLKIYHRLERREDYERLRSDFNGVFNAGAPAFDQFSDEGRGLEFCERALARIQALWPEPRVLDVIEKSIFRETDDPQAEVFDLEAYRELLLLYAIAKEMIGHQAVDSKLPKDF